jgi:flagellum-specific peptidoglycan hydrolase FlgJ
MPVHGVSSTTPASSSSSASDPTLQQGASGNAVKTLQSLLKAKGFFTGTPDGAFGPRTKADVVAFQKAAGLTHDGVVGPRTWAALRGAARVTPSLPTTGNAFIDSVAPGAVAARKQFGVPASVSIAQGILESGWGQSALATRAHNLFGMKGSGPAGSVTEPTKEFQNGHWVTINAAFRAYHNAAESIQDHAKSLATQPVYANAMTKKGNAKAFANALTGVYATAPNYGQSLISIMDRHNLYQFDT